MLNIKHSILQRLKLKVCGMRDAQNILEVASCIQPHYMGFIFYEKSKRYVGESFSEEVLSAVSASIKKTGVFVNAPYEYIVNKINRYTLDAVQLHGEEAPDLCARLKANGTEIIKVFLLDKDFSFSELEPYEKHCDYYLFDTKTKDYGGSGTSFDWEILKKYKSEKPFFLSGGIDTDCAEKLKTLSSLPLYAIDVNSKFETSPGMKNVEKLKHLVTLLNA
ncbi:MAG: phosphoribosylanthranilate isomerase [Cytophagaceae bacterium]|nr:phosphoribosylanthranilate isomerase [Cytophagaceae bacterium]MDW8455465.1 phosphoribosylanthranilate isomerase [Cytophagaceae bacterium]